MYRYYAAAVIGYASAPFQRKKSYICTRCCAKIHMAYETAIFRNTSLYSFTGDRKNLKHIYLTNI